MYEYLLAELEGFLPITSGSGQLDDYGCVIQFGWHIHCGYLLFALNDRERAVELCYEANRQMVQRWPDMAEYFNPLTGEPLC